MQLQVECTGFSTVAQPCWVCKETFEMKEGRVIICDGQGDRYGEVCPECIGRGYSWLNNQFERLVQQVSRPQTSSRKRSRQYDELIGA
jgi:hypothetical protein